MFRDLVSYLVLILVPVVSLAIAIVPFVVVKRRLKSSPFSVIATPTSDVGGGDLTKAEYHQGKIASSSKTPRNDNSEETGTYPHPSATKPHITSRLWGAFVIGLVGNVMWWWVVGLRPSKFSLYTGDTESTGVIFGFFLYSFFIIILPFIFYKIKHGHFTGKAIVYNLIVSLLTAGIVLGVWIVLAVVAYRGLFYQLN